MSFHRATGTAGHCAKVSARHIKLLSCTTVCLTVYTISISVSILGITQALFASRIPSATGRAF